MKSSVIIKGNKYGFQIVLNPTLPFEELLREVGDKFKESTHFFDLKKPIAVSFTGRELTSGEQNLLVDTITENSGLNISCVIDGAKAYETQFAKVLSDLKEEEKKERLDDTSDGGDTCFLKKSYARAGGQEEFSNQSPARLRERFFKKLLSSVSLCHSGTSRLSTISILLRPRKQVT